MNDYLVVYTTKNEFYQNENDTTDHYEAFLNDKEEAEKRYKEVLKMDNLWSASLCVPIQSDQYETSTDYKNYNEIYYEKFIFLHRIPFDYCNSSSTPKIY